MATSHTSARRRISFAMRAASRRRSTGPRGPRSASGAEICTCRANPEHPNHMEPYRDAGGMEPAKTAVVKRRTWRVPWFLVAAGVSAGALAIAGAPAAVVAIMGGGVAAYGGAVTGWFRRTRAANALDG